MSSGLDRVIFPPLLVLTSLVALSRSAVSQTVEPPPSPQHDLAKGGVRVSLSLPGVHGIATYHVDEQEVSIEWFFRTPTGAPRSSFQTYPLPFWPTEVASFGTNGVLVAGTSTLTGGISIERWELIPPSALPQPFISPQTGQLVQPGLAVPVKKKVQIFTSDGARGNVRLLMKRQGTAHQAFVQFWGDRNLYSLDTSSGQLAKVLTIQPDGLVPIVPGLADVDGPRWARKHQEHGYVYHLGKLPGDLAGLFLFDFDLDGALDEIGSLSWDEFWERRLDKALEYQAWY